MKTNLLIRMIALSIATLLLFTACTTPNVENPPVVVCQHEVGEGGSVIHDGEGYYFQRICTKCGEGVNEPLSLVSFNTKWLYDENQHWQNIKATRVDETVSESLKINLDAHSFDENGICTGCAYNKNASNGLLFELNEEGTGYVLVGLGDCTDAHVNVPEEYEGLPVVAIGDNALDVAEEETISLWSNESSTDEEEEKPTTSRRQRVIGITIPKTVISISCTALAECESLVNFIVDSANEVYKAMNNCLIDTVVGSIVRGCEFSVIPEDGSVTIVGSYAFANSEGLVSITIPDSVTDVGDKAFLECDALVEITMPENINIGIDVFRGSIHVEIKVEHTLTHVPAKEATCYEAGNVEHYVCSDCGYFYKDDQASERLYEVAIPASHNFVDGSCTECGKVMDEILIVRVDQVPNLGKFPLGTLENAIGLPTTINVYTKDGVKHELGVAWNLSDYDKSQVGTYTITGVIQSDVFRFDEGLTNSISASIEIVEFMKGTADIVFILDISGSMGDEVSNVKNNIVRFAQAIEEQGVSARWSAITYSDWTCSSAANEQSTIIKNGAADWFISAEEYKSAINGIYLANGGDSPETAIDGMMLANTALSTRQDARVFYILLTDDSNKVNNHYNINSLDECADVLAADGVNVSVITTTTYYNHYSCLTNKTGGIMTNIYNNFSQALLDNLIPIIYGEVIS